ncbi:MAG: methylamine dehydrogenase accessory protein MauD [Bauldia sp.]|nr:methylamine dehydrogenase accessory protein MauD [Bauldia sp.]MCW5718487.1 methylamine dehydrogenase accessory protein MauD [Bauldia sp.]
MTGLIFAVVVLWIVVLGLIVALFAMARQTGVLFERISPMGALINDAGPKIGDASPRFTLPNLNGGVVSLGGPADRSRLLFFLSPTCPVCKKLLPIVKSIATSERSWLDIVLASDGEEQKHREFIERAGLAAFPYVLSSDLGVTFRVSRLPFAVLIDEAGTIRSKGLINNREQFESLFNAKELGVDSIQTFIEQLKPTNS